MDQGRCGQCSGTLRVLGAWRASGAWPNNPLFREMDPSVRVLLPAAGRDAGLDPGEFVDEYGCVVASSHVALACFPFVLGSCVAGHI